MFFFCFKQKTAYEMRISDWSSDVCSSDLAVGVTREAYYDDAVLVRLLFRTGRRIYGYDDTVESGRRFNESCVVDVLTAPEGTGDITEDLAFEFLPTKTSAFVPVVHLFDGGGG